MRGRGSMGRILLAGRTLLRGAAILLAAGLAAGPAVAQKAAGGAQKAAGDTQKTAGDTQKTARGPQKAAPREASEPVTVDADRMERYGKENIVVFTGHVVARQAGSIQYADRTEVYLDEKGDRIARIVSTGNVRVVTRDCKTGTARRAEYTDLDQRLVLSGNARVWEDENVVTGETITIYLDEDRSVVEGGRQERVRAVIHPRERDGGAQHPARTCPE